MTVDTRERDNEVGGAEAEGAVGLLEADDIYAVLGVRTDASSLLAREMYWSRIQPLLDPERRDDPDARATIEALNRAMAIITDSDLRAEYDVYSGIERPSTEATPGLVRALRWTWRGLLGAGLASAVALVGTQVSWALGLTFAGSLAVLLLCGYLVSRAARPRPSAYARLGLDDGASTRDLDVAYQARAQELLVRLGSDPRVPEALDRLDRDYLDAMREHIAPEEASRRVPGLVTWFARASLTVGAALGRGAYQAGRGATGHAARLGTRTATSVQRRVAEAPPARPASPAAGRPAATREAAPAVRGRALAPLRLEPEAPAIDLERRLAASLKASTLEIARETVVTPPADAPPTRAAQPSAFLLLFASVGVRRVPIGERPIRIGSAGDCDLVLPERDGVAPEHALVWRRGDAVVLHVTDPAGECAVNGRNSTWATLEHDDELRIGKVDLRIEIEVPAE